MAQDSLAAAGSHVSVKRETPEDRTAPRSAAAPATPPTHGSAITEVSIQTEPAKKRAHRARHIIKAGSPKASVEKAKSSS